MTLPGQAAMQPAEFEQDFGRRWRPVLIGYFMRRVRDHAEAEDLAQEVLLRLLDKEREDINLPEAYVFRMASNLLADRARRNKVRARYRALVSNDASRAVDPLDPARVLTGRSQVAAVSQTLNDLPERTRTIFILFRIEAIGQDVIAETFGISVSAVKKHVARAMVALMKSIEVAE